MSTSAHSSKANLKPRFKAIAEMWNITHNTGRNGVRLFVLSLYSLAQFVTAFISNVHVQCQ